MPLPELSQLKESPRGLTEQPKRNFADAVVNDLLPRLKNTQDAFTLMGDAALLDSVELMFDEPDFPLNQLSDQELKLLSDTLPILSKELDRLLYCNYRIQFNISLLNARITDTLKLKGAVRMEAAATLGN